MGRARAAVVVTRDRPDDYRDCIRALAPQVDYLITVAHMDPGYVWDALGGVNMWLGIGLQVIPCYEDPPNISRMWNLGLDSAPDFFGDWPYDVAVLNDDAIVPPGWFDRVATKMRRSGAAAGSVRRDHDSRMAGYAFVLDGDAGIRADEQFQWWYGDDDIEEQARRAGGVAFVVGPGVEHRHPNSTTVGILAEVAAEDRVRFERKWGR